MFFTHHFTRTIRWNIMLKTLQVWCDIGLYVKMDTNQRMSKNLESKDWYQNDAPNSNCVENKRKKMKILASFTPLQSTRIYYLVSRSYFISFFRLKFCANDSTTTTTTTTADDEDDNDDEGVPVPQAFFIFIFFKSYFFWPVTLSGVGNKINTFWKWTFIILMFSKNWTGATYF